MAKKKNVDRVFYYEDELHDDFASFDITRKEIKKNYKYFNYNIFSLLGGWLFRIFVAFPLLAFANLFFYHSHLKNRKVLRLVKRKGYYMYANHVLSFDPIVHPILINPTRYCIIVAGPETFSINPFVSWLVKSLGAVPIPNKLDLKMYDHYTEYLSHHVKRRHRVLIYPEAHIWPYCTLIRHFSHSSFRYPVNDNVPVMVATTVFKKHKHRQKPTPIIYLDGPFYPNLELDTNERIDDLALRVRQAMLKRSEVEWNYPYIRYERKNKKEKALDN
ncbi:MAG: 1-acyl-sn-glycerol-3-phosphate acyltransferase [Bacilli bacterium]